MSLIDESDVKIEINFPNLPTLQTLLNHSLFPENYVFNYFPTRNIHYA